MLKIFCGALSHIFEIWKQTLKNVLITFCSAKIVKTSLKRLSVEANILAWKHWPVLTNTNVGFAFA